MKTYDDLRMAVETGTGMDLEDLCEWNVLDAYMREIAAEALAGLEAAKKAKHTPGPWDRTSGLDCRRRPMSTDIARVCTGADDYVVISKHNTDAIDPLEHSANARLISAAPDMLRALRGILVQDTGDLTDAQFRRYVCDRLVAPAIARAEGGGR